MKEVWRLAAACVLATGSEPHRSSGPLDHSDDDTQVDTFVPCRPQVSESFPKNAPPKAARSPAAVELRQNNLPLIVWPVTPPRPPDTSAAAAVKSRCCWAFTLVDIDLHGRKCVGKSIWGPAPTCTARKACLRGELDDRRRRVQRASSSPSLAEAPRALEAASVQSVGTPLSRGKGALCTVQTLVWIEDNPKAKASTARRKAWQGRAEHTGCESRARQSRACFER